VLSKAAEGGLNSRRGFYHRNNCESGEGEEKRKVPSLFLVSILETKSCTIAEFFRTVGGLSGKGRTQPPTTFLLLKGTLLSMYQKGENTPSPSFSFLCVKRKKAFFVWGGKEESSPLFPRKRPLLPSYWRVGALKPREGEGTPFLETRGFSIIRGDNGEKKPR